MYSSFEHLSEEAECLYNDDGIQRPKLPKSSRVLINTAAGLEGADDQMLPASFHAMERELSFTPLQLGHLSMYQFIAWAASNPVWGFLSDIVDRKYILVAGCLCWGVATLALSVSSTFGVIAVFRVVNGFFLGSLGPVCQAVLADNTSSEKRGLMFGFVQMSANLGRICGVLITTSIGSLLIWGVHGWRWSVAGAGVLSVMLGLIILVCMPTIPRIYHRREVDAQTTLGFIGASTRSIFRTPSIIILLVEGFTAQIPFNAFAFLTMYFQYCGLNDYQAGVVTSMMLLGCMISAPCGGYLSDQLNIRITRNRQISRRTSFRLEARPLIAQVAMLMRIPVLVFLFIVTERNSTSFWTFAALSFLLGLFSFAGSAASRPILSDVVLPEYRATAFSISCSIEGVCSAFLGAPLVGYLAQNTFGYVTSQAAIQDLVPEARSVNAKALATALLYMSSIPWLISSILFVGLHFTYGRDAEKIEVQRLNSHRIAPAIDENPSPTNVSLHFRGRFIEADSEESNGTSDDISS